jgi:hypothetical protein
MLPAGLEIFCRNPVAFIQHAPKIATGYRSKSLDAVVFSFGLLCISLLAKARSWGLPSRDRDKRYPDHRPGSGLYAALQADRKLCAVAGTLKSKIVAAMQ